MATLASLTEEVKRIVSDKSFTDDDIMTYLNRGILEIAGGIKRLDSSTLTQPLPLLYTIGTVLTTPLATAALPTDYQRALVFVSDKEGRELSIYDSFVEFVKTYPLLNAPGFLNAVGIKGKTLYYQNIPAVPEAVTIHYHRYPVDMVSGNDEPDGIPLELQSSLLVNYACMEIYTLKEEGIDGSMFNTQKYEKRFWDAMGALEASIAAEAPPFSFFS